MEIYSPSSTVIQMKDGHVFGCKIKPFPAFMTIVVFVCFVALRPKSTAMVMVGRSVHLNTLFPGQA